LVVLIVILLHQNRIIGINHVLDISGVFNVFSFQDYLGVDGELLDHLEEPVEDTP